MNQRFSLQIQRWVWDFKRYYEWIRVVGRFYWRWEFAKVDLALCGRYAWLSAYAIHRRFMQRQGALDPYTYGETPLTTLALMAKQAEVSSKDCVVELGCGSGRTAFWLRMWCGCEVIGVDQVPAFIHNAKEVQRRGQLGKMEWIQGDFLSEEVLIKIQKATLITISTFHMTEEELSLLKERLRSDFPFLKRIISIGEALTDDFQMKLLPFYWGKSEVYFNNLAL